MKIPYNIYNHKYFWSLRNKLQRTNSFFKKKSYNAKEIINEEKYKAFSFIRYAKLTVGSILKAIFFVTFLYCIEFFISLFWNNNFETFPGWIIKFQQFIPKPSYPKDIDVIIELISVIASITGVILALFYPVLATIIGTAYSKVHESIRNLILREKNTQDYLRKLTFTTAFSITVLLAFSLGFYPGTLILLTLFLLALVSLFNILKTGIGIYTLLEPHNLLNLIVTDISKNIKNVTTEGLYWNDKNFQYNNYIRAYQSTENINLITQLCIQDYIKESSFKLSIKKSLHILRYYLSQKPKIPVDSLWFPKIYNHISYFESDMTYRGLSKNTGTYIQPKEKQNQYWLEERIIESISKGTESLVSNKGQVHVLTDIIFMFHPIFDSLGYSTDIRTSQILLNKLLQNLKVLSSDITTDQEIQNYEDWKHELSSIETYCYALLKFQIGILSRATQFDSTKINTEYEKINWQKKDSIYLTDFISELYEFLNNYRNFVSNEIYVEGKRITPDWYFKQLLTAEYLIKITEKIKEAINSFDKFLLELAIHFNNKKNPLLASFTTHIGIEIISKIRFRIGQLKHTFIDIDKLEICKGEFKWVKPDFETIEAQIKKYEQECISIISLNIEKLSLLKWNNQFPDVFAQSYSILSDHINICFYENDLVHFKIYFPAFLKSALKAFGNLNKIFKDYSMPQNISYQTLIDLMELSGYAYIYSVIYKNEDFWISTKDAWDKDFLPEKENIDLLVNYYEYYKGNLYGVGVNYTEKHQREGVLSEVTQKLKLKSADVEDWLVSQFIRDSYFPSFYDVAELFIEIYLFTFVESKDATKLLRRELFKQWCRHINNPNPKKYGGF
ncbi:MAG: hypothetical protein WC868_00215 [Bacteroidales bacterium]